MSDPNQTTERGEWLCPCSGCQKSIAAERNQLIEAILDHQYEYLMYRGSSFDLDNNLVWAKDDAMAYSEGLDKVIELIKNRMPKPKKKIQ